MLGRDDNCRSFGRLAVFEAKGDLALGVGLEERRRARVPVAGHLEEDLVAVVEGGRHQVGSLVASETEHDPLVASALVLVAGGIDALGNMRRLAVEVIFEVGGFPVETLLLVADSLDRSADHFLDFVAGAGRPAVRLPELVRIVNRPAADFAADDDPLRRNERLAGDPRLRIL